MKFIRGYQILPIPEGYTAAMQKPTIHVTGREVSKPQSQQVKVVKQGNETVVVYE